MSQELLIHFDEKNYQYNIERLENFISDSFEKSISKFNKLGIGTFEKENFIPFFSDPENFLFEALMDGKPLEVAGMKVSKVRLFDLLEKPTGYYTLISEIKALPDELNRLSPKFFTNNLLTFLNYFEFDATNKIYIKSEVKDMLKKKSEVWVKNEDSKQLFKAFKEMEKLFNSTPLIIENTSPPFYLVGDFIRKYLPFDSDSKKFNLDIEKIKYHDNRI